jgi:putative ABC transport system substrate-binding protein
VKQGESFVTRPPGLVGRQLYRRPIFRLFRFWTAFKFLEETMQAKFFSYLVAAAILTAIDPALAQQPPKMPRIGFLSSAGDSNNPGPQVEAFRRGLRDLGYYEGKNILIEYRYLEGKRDRIPGLVAELQQLKVDALIVGTPPAIRAGKQATKTIPIVIVTSQDPVAAGYVDSLARPGGNITGLTTLARDLSGKRLELLKEVVPGMSRVGLFLVTDPGSPRNALKEYETAAGALKIALQSLEVRSPNPDIDGAFREAVNAQLSALITTTNFVLSPYRKKIGDLAIKNRLPLLSEGSNYVDAGGLMSYAASDVDLWRRAATYVDKILKGAKPADLPIEQPTKFELVINLKTAKQIGLTIPQTVLFRADKVIK